MSTQPRHQMPCVGWLRTRTPWVVIGILLVSGIGSAAYAFWQSISSSNFAAAVGDVVNPGSKPSASITGADISISWAAGATSGGRPATGYTVARYDSATGGSKTPATGACGGTVTVLSCAEQNVPGGTWYYTVTPAIALWDGAESPRSDGVSTDSTPPVASVASISPTPNASGLNNSSPVVVNLTAEDNAGGSGVASITYSVDSGSPTTVNAANSAVTVGGDGTHVVSYFATDNAGNASASQNLAVKIDTVAPGTPSIVVPTYVNIANVANVPVNGTAEPGSTLTLTVTDAGAAHTVSQTVAASGTGAWTATGLNLTSLNQGTVTYTAKATDAAGNTGSTVTVTSIKDTLAPAAPTISAPTYVNIANAANVPVSGTAESGSAVTLLVTDVGAAHTVSQSATAGGGAWSASSLNLSALNDGAVTYTATATDAAGNTGTSAAVTKTKDTVAPGLPTVSVPPFVNAANVANVPVSGTAEPGATVAMTVTDTGPANTVSQTVTANGAGAWSASALNLTTLNQGTVTYKVTATDAAGNASAIATTTNTKDTVSATPGITVPTYITSTNAAGVPVNGTSDAGALVTLTVTDAGQAHSISQTVTATGSGTWSMTLDLSAYVDGTISYSARGTDPAGNVSAAGTATGTKDIVAPTVTGVALTNGGVAGTADGGDSVIITYSERMDATKFCGSWNNTGPGLQSLNTNGDVVVTLTDNAAGDRVTVTSGKCTLNIGSVTLEKNYINSGTATFQGSGSNRSSVQWDPVNYKLTIVLGTKTGTVATGILDGTSSYTPASGLSDLAGYLLSTTPFTPTSTSRF
ncbi:Ig-like domain-containing protein [Pseudarthrobacter sp. HLT3-5]|uniref:Ig-like domain-containing protein n=1 Tax=Pseudarthrobacter cellobiosi TaxID=2953654 RepID=UPI00208F0210|nr:Ig-like domain-containing protein [Pseudarthrobacter sp. HLT3-5]MCO4276780.1 Ig-like domain-containing protein [Pseudarthrobacter sp. HLT3-5]